ncbi:MAG: hypothetical protein FGM23_00995 [Alphaproteobacteria bacterium]|nr:hypothetical protein [Alphaproteobacteria bacterium]
MPTTDNVRVFPEKAGIRERGFATRVTGRLDDSNSIVFGELLREWHCHFTGNPKAVLPYLNRKTLDLSNPDHRRRVSSEWWQACETEPSDEFVKKTAGSVRRLTHDVLHLINGFPPNWPGEYYVDYAEPLVWLQLGYGMNGMPFNKDGLKEQLSARPSFFRKVAFDKTTLESWYAKTSMGGEGLLSIYFAATTLGAHDLRNIKQFSISDCKARYQIHSNITPEFLDRSLAAQWRYAGLLTSLVEINRDGGNPVDVTKPWNLVALRVPFDVVRRMRGAFPVRQEDKQAIREGKEAFGEDAAGVPLIEPRLLCFPPNLRARIQAFEAKYGKESAHRGDCLKPDMSLFTSITPHMDQRDGANQAIQLIPTYDRWARIQRGEEPTSLEKLAARARQAAARPSQERPSVDIDIGAILLEQFTQLVTR